MWFCNGTKPERRSEAFERKRQGLPIIAPTHSEYGKLKLSLQQNEMFVFGMNKEELELELKQLKYSIISILINKNKDVHSLFESFQPKIYST